MTTTFKRRAIRQWASYFPDLGVWSLNEAGKVLGPIYMGLVLDRDSSNEGYYPTFHVSSFLLASKNVFLGLQHRLRAVKHGVDEKVTVKRHDAGIDELVERFRNEIPLPLSGPVTAEMILVALLRFNSDGKQFPDGTKLFKESKYYTQVCIAMTVFGWIGDAASQAKLGRQALNWVAGEEEWYRKRLEDGTVQKIEWAATVRRQELELLNAEAKKSMKMEKVRIFDFS